MGMTDTNWASKIALDLNGERPRGAEEHVRLSLSLSTF